MGTACGPVLGIVGPCPERMADGFAGPLHEGLSKKLRALESPVDPPAVSPAVGDRGNARRLLDRSGGGIAFALFAKGDEETRGEDGTGAGERMKEREVGMPWGQLRHGVVETLDRLH